MSGRKKRWIWIGAVLLIAGGAGGFYAWKEYHRQAADTTGLRADFRLEATELVKAFEVNQQQAHTRYADKVIEASGSVKDVLRDDDGLYTVVIGDPSVLSSVRCSMDSMHNSEAGSLARGMPATLKGICSGFNADELLGSDVVLIRCVVSNRK